jgi:Na+/glutamate symporter
MNTTAKILLAATGVLVVCGYALGQDAETIFKKRGTSIAVQKRDSAQCWRTAEKTKLTEEQATQNLVTGYLIGGVIGVLLVQSNNEEANKDPKSAFRRQVHDECMTKRGYEKVN